ncbi:hypothetical protein N7536_000109 [Penicillium majusculum]|nr:hypothetical protein N7536_000109 [Penicillium majusculum]
MVEEILRTIATLNTRAVRAEKIIAKYEHDLAIARHTLADTSKELQESYRVGNYYSLTAIIQGIKASRLHTKALGDFGYLIDSENNYERYRRRAKTRPGMDFFFPALNAAVRGNFTFASEVIDRFARYNLEDYQRHSFVCFVTACFGH